MILGTRPRSSPLPLHPQQIPFKTLPLSWERMSQGPWPPRWPAPLLADGGGGGTVEKVVLVISTHWMSHGLGAPPRVPPDPGCKHLRTGEMSTSSRAHSLYSFSLQPSNCSPSAGSCGGHARPAPSPPVTGSPKALSVLEGDLCPQSPGLVAAS